MDYLPNEILEEILCFVVCTRNLLTLKLVCRRFKELVQGIYNHNEPRGRHFQWNLAHGNHQEISRLLEDRHIINAANQYQYFYWACHFGNINCAKILLEYPTTDPNLGSTLPILAAYRSNLQLFYFLLNHPSIDLYYGNCLLLRVSLQRGCFTLVESLLPKINLDSFTISQIIRDTPGLIPHTTFKLLLDNIPIEQVTSLVDGTAYWHENESVLNIILDRVDSMPADVVFYQNMFLCACKHGFIKTLERILKRGLTFCFSHYFLGTKKIETLKLLLRKPNVKITQSSYSELYKFGDMELIQMALDRKDAPVFELAKEALRFDKIEIIFYILDKKILDALTLLRVGDCTSLEMLAQVVQYSMQQGIDIVREIRIVDCFHACCLQENLSFLELLLNHGAILQYYPPHIITQDIIPPLEQSGKNKTVEFLIEFVNKKVNFFFSPP